MRPLVGEKKIFGSITAGNYRPDSNNPVLGKMVKCAVASQLLGFMEETDYLDPFKSSVRPGYGTETTLVALATSFVPRSPMLSTIYMKLLDKVIRKHGIGCRQYVDDTRLYLSLSFDPKTVVEY